MPIRSSDLVRRLRAERRRRLISQSTLAARVGISQPAISKFERGESALSDATIRALAEQLGIEIDPESTPIEGGVSGSGLIRFFCPDVDCPSNYPWLMADRCILVPRQTLALPVAGPICPDCGEILESQCGGCGHLVNEGAHCEHCARAYLAPLPSSPELVRSVESRLVAVRELRAFTSPRIIHPAPSSG